MINFISQSINFLQEHLLSFFLGYIVLLFLGLLVFIKSEGKKINTQNITETLQRAWKGMEFKKTAKHAFKMFFNPWAHYKELQKK